MVVLVHYTGNIIRHRVILQQIEAMIGSAKWDLIVQNQSGTALRMEATAQHGTGEREKL
jgi:hypothetical protein